MLTTGVSCALGTAVYQFIQCKTTNNLIIKCITVCSDFADEIRIKSYLPLICGSEKVLKRTDFI